MNEAYTEEIVEQYARDVIKGEYGPGGKILKEMLSSDPENVGVFERIMTRVAEILLSESVEDPPPDEPAEKSETILSSIKALLGLSEDNRDFDKNLVIFINSAIFSLRQLGVGPLKEPFSLTPENAETATYQDYLGEEFVKETSEVKTYIYYKVLLSFDPPSNNSAIQVIQQSLKESEWRLTANVELPILNGKEEIQNGADDVSVPEQ